jgi:hypothetical protein
MAAAAMSTTTAMSEAAMSAEAMPRETVTPAAMGVGHFGMTIPATMSPTMVPTTPAPIAIGWVVTGHRSAVADGLHASGQQEAQGNQEGKRRHSGAAHRNLRCSSSPVLGADFATMDYILSKTST